MTFAQLIMDKIGSLLSSHGLSLIEQRDDYLKLKSDRLVLVIAHNKLERSNALYTGRHENDMIPIDESVLRNIFDFNLKMSFVVPEIFADRLRTLIEGVGRPLIEGNEAMLKSVESFIRSASREYTKSLQNRQKLERADKAWLDKDYRAFLEIMGQVDSSILSPAYKQKYEIALRRMNE